MGRTRLVHHRDAAVTRQRFSLFSWCSHFTNRFTVKPFRLYCFRKIIKNASGIQTIRHFLYCSWYFVFLSISFQPECNSKTAHEDLKLVHRVQALERGDVFLLENEFSVVHTHFWFAVSARCPSKHCSIIIRSIIPVFPFWFWLFAFKSKTVVNGEYF